MAQELQITQGIYYSDFETTVLELELSTRCSNNGLVGSSCGFKIRG